MVVCDERGIKQAKEDAVNMEGWLRKQKGPFVRAYVRACLPAWIGCT